MADEIQIWAIDEMAEITKVEPTGQTATEKLLEDAIVKDPDMLMSGLALVGRQTPNAGGDLDLLGVDEEGRLVVFELKRSKLTREAVTQVIDYCSALESMSDDDRAAHIAERSGQSGITKIEDFEEWYYEQDFGEQASLTPVRMALVGLGVDDNASRMVDFLAKRGVDITLLTFHGYQYDGKTLLAKQVQQDGSAAEPLVKPRPSREDRRKALAEHAEKSGMGDFWKEVTERFTNLGYTEEFLKTKLSFCLRPLKMQGLSWGKTVRSVHSVQLEASSKRIRITFFPVAIHLCQEKFEEQKEVIPFKQKPPSNVSKTDRVSEQWYCLLDNKEWETHRDTLTTLASEVHTEWEARRKAN